MNRRSIKFPLIMGNGAEVRTLEELRENFNLESVIGYFVDGKLKVWLNDRYYEEEAMQVEQLEGKEKSNALKEKLCEILGVEYENKGDLNIEEIELRQEKISKLRLYTDDPNIINEVDIVAFDQEDLSDLLDGNEGKIYLCSGEFTVPIGRKNVSYYGISNPIVKIASKNDVDYDNNNIIFNDVIISSQNIVSVKISKSKGIKLAGNIIDETLKINNEESVVDTCWDKVNINTYAQYKNSIYYYDDLNGVFYKMNKISNEKIKVSDETMEKFKIEEDIIYYKNERNLYAIDLDGKNKTLIQNDICDFDVNTGNIYFTKYGEYYRSWSWGPEKAVSTKPYIVNIKENTVKSIPYGDNEGGVDNIKVSDGWLYFVYSYDNGLYRIKSNLTSKQKITGEDVHVSDYYIDGEWIYFIDSVNCFEANKGIKRIKLNGSGETVICEDITIQFEKSGSYIFFISEDYSIYRTNLDGSNKIKICIDCSRVIGKTTHIGCFRVIGDWLYYQNGKKDFIIYKVNINGGNPIMVE